MYIKSENPQTLQSKQMITDALLRLMRIYSFEDITITQICQEAQVVRQTFYRNFEMKTDILEFYLDNLFQKYISDHSKSEIDTYQQIKSFFDYLILRKDFLILIEKNNLFFLFNKSLNKTISIVISISNEEKNPKTIKNPIYETYVLGFLASTICSILSLWIKNDFEESPEMLADMAMTFFNGLMKH
jgi:AcrR family transcriptional regulator